MGTKNDVDYLGASEIILILMIELFYFQLGGKDIIYLERTRIDHFKQNVVIGLERKEKKEWWT